MARRSGRALCRVLCLAAAGVCLAAAPAQPRRRLQGSSGAAATGINAFYRNTTFANVGYAAAVTASSSPVPGHDATSATDGDLRTSWLSGSAANQRLELDLGRAVLLTGYRIAWEGCGRGAISYELKGSLSAQHAALGGLLGAVALDSVQHDAQWSPADATGREDSALLEGAASATPVRYVELTMSARRGTDLGLCDEYGVREIELFEVSEHADECGGYAFPAFVVDEANGIDDNAGTAEAPFRTAERATKQLIKLVQQRPACVTPDGLVISFASSLQRSVVVFVGTDSCGNTAVVCLRQAGGQLVCECGINEVALEAYSRACAAGQILDEFECVDVDECGSSPCANSGECRDSLSHDYMAMGHYQCVCVTGWTGESCGVDVDECAVSAPCQNGGTCVNQLGDAYSCQCGQGFLGTNCGDNYDECVSSPCQNGGFCSNQLDGTSYDCHCNAGYAGDDCAIDVDECGSSPCLNGGLCSSSRNSYSCFCVDERFDGEHCENAVDPCDEKPCANGAHCQPMADGFGFQCFCVNGYAGETCAERIGDAAGATPPPPSPPPVVIPSSNGCTAAPAGFILCATGICQYVPLSDVNDGHADCSDGSDESSGSDPVPEDQPAATPAPAPAMETPAGVPAVDEEEGDEKTAAALLATCDPYCAEGQYCDLSRSCYDCSYIESSVNCDAVGEDCCSSEFLQSCPSDPAGCAAVSPLVYALFFVGAVAGAVLVVRCVKSRKVDKPQGKQYALVSTGAGDDAWDKCVDKPSQV